jgi:hypothetical protein
MEHAQDLGCVCENDELTIGVLGRRLRFEHGAA